ncbi:hypothetical protein AGMMS50268_13410 [Spirochaetia bacterium]|nr:hypothetical protein AGMMS50268_13410 [Spirochaetia bacterium]
MGKEALKKYGNRPEGFTPSALQAGRIQPGSAFIRVLDGYQNNYKPCGENLQGGF